MYVTGRKATDPEGTVQPPVVVQDSEAFYSGDLGHYSGIALDPVADSFWAVNAYSTANFPSGWSTAIANFEITADGSGAAASPRRYPPRARAGAEPAHQPSFPTT